ncbi:MAG: heme biosynthesis protein HemY [Gammaproteobacteria bacterium]|nr:heme biosynthesis protein HemY [Gammaproteobacteria bacterium]
MRWLFSILSVLTLAAALALYLQQDPGYVLLGHGHYSVEMSLTLFILALLLGFAVLWLVIYVVTGLWGMPGSLKRWRKRQRLERARRDTLRGLIQLAEGNWEKAERFLIRHAYDSDLPLLNYLAAARAAHKQNRADKRDEYYRLAQHTTAESSFAVDLAKSEMQLLSGQLQEALANLQPLHKQSPLHPQVLFLLARAYEAMRNWDELRALLPSLHRREVFGEQQLNLLEQKVYRELLTLATQHNNVKQLTDLWQAMTRRMQQNVDMARHYARCLMALEQQGMAEGVVRETLKRGYDRDLIYLYGLIVTKESDKQLATAEKWLNGNERDPVLLLTLGRLCYRHQLWGKARAYLDTSLGLEPRSDTLRELGQLMDRLNQPKEAAEYYRRGLILAQEEKLDDLITVTPQVQSVLSI